MLRNLQLTTYIKRNNEESLLRIPIHRDLQESLEVLWTEQYLAFTSETQEVVFSAGYTPNDDERFVINDFELLEHLNISREHTRNLTSIASCADQLNSVKAIIAFAQDEEGNELMLFQKFMKSHIIQPGRSLFLASDTYTSSNKPGLTLGNKLDAVVFKDELKLLFQNFRTTNVFLPLGDFYREVTETQIIEILQHDNISIDRPEALAHKASQWFKTRFSMLKDSGVLDSYTPSQIRGDASGYEVEIEIDTSAGHEQIIFPTDKTKAKKLLQFLNEEIYKGAITQKLYETNSKRDAE
ncbi:hypothetical protein LNTAR_10246 [Lentisphaera araneosa HTCC2155]|uniref:DUF4868 domain-containing protein n=1 Tax=Lentisphaera araneosa HTCC2155 TaxID=313628 RepID=A6DIK2_9BACT|nr:hypothetical protein [Lentisphaera araneosa]EDM28288.1 hypothetical protein LNTAR_10246 [Lentisphaera araneosa HTCC2155]